MVKLITLVCDQNKNYQNKNWVILPKSYLPEDNQGVNEIEALYNEIFG